MKRTSRHQNRARTVMPYRWFAVHVILACLLWLGGSVAPAQPTAPAEQSPKPAGPATAPAAPTPSVAGPVRPETVTTRKAAVQTRLEALANLPLTPADTEALRATLGQKPP